MCVGGAGGTEKGSEKAGVPRLYRRCNDAHLNEGQCSCVCQAAHV